MGRILIAVLILVGLLMAIFMSPTPAYAGNATAISINSSKVFQSFLETGDQLYVFSYVVDVEEGYLSQDSRYFYNLQLVGVNDSTVYAQVKLPAWDYKPGSIYVNADEALPWGLAYTIRVEGITGTYFEGSSANYTLQSSDWLGSDLYYLDDWVFALATSMETYYEVTLVIGEQDREVLNEVGGIVFMVGIPGLAEGRLHLFQAALFPEELAQIEYTTDYQDTLTGALGERAEEAFTDIGELTGLSWGFVSQSFWLWIIVMAIGLLGVAAGHPLVGLISSIPMLFAGAMMGIIPLIWILAPALLLGAWILYKIWVRGS